MISVLFSVRQTIRGVARSRAGLHLEVLALRHQLRVMQRSRPRRLRLVQPHRWPWAWRSSVWSAWRPALVILQLLMLSAERTYGTADPADLYTRMYTVPWVPGETERLQRFLTKPEDAIAAGFNPHGVIPRINGSPFYGTRVPDLHLLRYNKYIDATGTHRLRGPEDIARYAAIINSADPMDFGTHRFLTDKRRLCRNTNSSR